MSDQEKITRIPGLFEQLAEALADAVRPVIEFFAGFDVIESELLEPGTTVHDDGKIYMHPIDALILTGKYGTGIDAQLAASLAWQHQKINARFDALTDEIEAMGR